MRRPRDVRLKAWSSAAALLLSAAVGFPGCAKKVKVQFERPPAVSTAPVPEETPPQQTEQEPQSAPTPPQPEVEVGPPEEELPPKPVLRSEPASPPEPMPPPEPPETRLSESGNSLESRSILEKLTRAEAILSTLQKRSLTEKQREQVAAAQAFVTQARKAYAERDYRRAAVLVDKGLILAEDVQSAIGTGRDRAKKSTRGRQDAKEQPQMNGNSKEHFH